MAFFDSCEIIVPMASWAQKRRFMYGGTVVAIILIIVGLWSFKTFYKPPTCFDNIMNGDEQGVDCGGSCQKLCASSFVTPSVAWTSFEPVASGLYNVAAYIINQNITGTAMNVPYHMVLYDNKGVEIVDVPGAVTLPPNRNTLAYIPIVSTGKIPVYRVFFEFTQFPDWKRQADTLGALKITDKRYTEDQSGSSLLVTLANSSVYTIGKFSVYVVLSDAKSNVIGFSKTIVDGVGPHATVTAPFTWPMSHNGAVISEEVLPVVE